MDTFNELVELLYRRWEIRNHGSYSAESLSIGGNGVWLFLTAAEDAMAIKLHWGKTPSHVVELPAAYSVEDFKEGIEWLVSAMGILDLYEEAVEKYLVDDKKRLEDWNKHRGDINIKRTCTQNETV